MLIVNSFRRAALPLFILENSFNQLNVKLVLIKKRVTNIILMSITK